MFTERADRKRKRLEELGEKDKIMYEQEQGASAYHDISVWICMVSAAWMNVMTMIQAGQH